MAVVVAAAAQVHLEFDFVIGLAFDPQIVQVVEAEGVIEMLPVLVLPVSVMLLALIEMMNYYVKYYFE